MERFFFADLTGALRLVALFVVALVLGVAAFAAAVAVLVADVLVADALGADALVETSLDFDSTGLGVAAGLDVFDSDAAAGFEGVSFDPKNDLGSTVSLLNKI